MYYTMPVLLPDDERKYEIYAWNPTANSGQWHVLDINADGSDDAFHQNISWTGAHGSNKQWIEFPAHQAPGGQWIKLGPGPHTEIDPAKNTDGRQIYFNPPDGYSNPTDVHAPKIYVQWQPYYDEGPIAFAAIRIVEFAPTVPGDFDSDGDVDGADFVIWQTNFPTATGAMLDDGDADGDGDVDGADFVVWQTNFPTTPAPAVSPVPEPAGALLLLLGSAILLCCKSVAA